jgi:hypothetical protein
MTPDGLLNKLIMDKHFFLMKLLANSTPIIVFPYYITLSCCGFETKITILELKNFKQEAIVDHQYQIKSLTHTFT